MENIVKTGMKIDLHIHSCASAAKDGKKVSKNTAKNISVLIDRLDNQEVNICSITDHDIFSYKIYKALKEAETGNNTIKKVLPGIEFSVRFKNKDYMQKVIHIVAIFSDEDDAKVKNIEEILKNFRPDIEASYSEENFLEVLRTIDIDTILIAHQKNSLLSKNQRKNDANSLGNEKFLEFIYSDYFEAFEFKNKRNEILNKNYLIQEKLENKISFVTGTDCHDWTVYPKEDQSDENMEFPYTYAKCLPTFKGLVMAITDVSRLKRINSFFSVDKFYLEHIDLSINGKQIQIPLSKGINVIIGDNSIGKSMLLHAITGFQKSGSKLLPKVKQGYKNYMDKNNIEISKQLSKNEVFYFDMQGEVREKFEENNLNATEFLSKYFPDGVNPHQYRLLIESEIDRMIEYLRRKFEIDATMKRLNKFVIEVPKTAPESLSFNNNLRSAKKKTKPFDDVVSKINEAEIILKQLQSLNIDVEDKEYISKQLEKMNELIRKYQSRVDKIKVENERIEKVAKTIIWISNKHKKGISDKQKKEIAFLDNTTVLKETIIDLINQTKDNCKYTPYIKDTVVSPHCNKIHNYEFVSKLKIDKIDTKYFTSFIKRTLKAKSEISWDTITEEELKEILLKYDYTTPVLQFFKEELIKNLEEDLQPANAIICDGMDQYEEMSSGLNAKIYFDLLSYENGRDGIYIIDQPEDNVSQKAIKTYLLEYFKMMGENRQVIMVTHNPQFIVNLDIDNLIFLHKKNDDIEIQYGALEFICDNYSVLDIVADNIDGGLDSIQKRWKRYEKVVNV